MSKSRRQELELLLRDALGNDYTEFALDTVLTLEDQMTENREHLSVVHERGILDQDDFARLVNRCFEVFVGMATEVIGPEACQTIYGFTPEQPIVIVKPFYAPIDTAPVIDAYNAALSLLEASMEADASIALVREILNSLDDLLSHGHTDDLKQIEGIGVHMEMKLWEAGVHSYVDLGTLSGDRLDAIAKQLGLTTTDIERQKWIESARSLAQRRLSERT